MTEIYPTKEAIQEHKDKVYQMILLYLLDHTPIELVDAAFKSLAGDGAVYLNQSENVNFTQVRAKLRKIRVIEVE
jgi:hypothetical protein